MAEKSIIDKIIEIGKILDSQPAPRAWLVWHRNLNFALNKRPPMFTAKHYIAIADVIHTQRKLAIDADDPIGNGVVRNARLEQINSVTLALSKIFEEDNPKFKQFTFIEGCNRDLKG